jgi:hypothetical protein
MAKSKLLDQVRQAARLRHMSLRTEEAYVRRSVANARKHLISRRERQHREPAGRPPVINRHLALHYRLLAGTVILATAGLDTRRALESACCG